MFIGHKIMNEMQETNEIQLNFKSDESLKGLRVNLVVYKNDMPSTSYGYKKTITVIDQGKVLANFKERYILRYELEAVDTMNNHYFDNAFEDNVYARLADYEEKYYFKRDQVNYKSIVKNGFLNINNDTAEGYMKYSDLNNMTKNATLAFYDPRTTKYEITDMSKDQLEWLQRKTFDQLINEEKILEKDIHKLNQLTTKEKFELIKAHSVKKFKPPIE